LTYTEAPQSEIEELLLELKAKIDSKIRLIIGSDGELLGGSDNSLLRGSEGNLEEG
jgi:hypothetical protein